jgi:predicted HAD superfamily Cof-like phosphohydrolase
MQKQIAQLIEFSDKFNAFYSDKPTKDIPENIKEVRKTLLKEEVQEVIQAIDSEPLENVAKELVDLVYVTLGAAIAFGLQEKFVEMFDAVHQSNLSKLDDNGKVILREDGKVLKGPNYKKADLKKILDAR